MIRSLAVGFLLLLNASSWAAPFHGSEVAKRDYSQRDIPLWDHHEQPRNLGEYRGKVVLVFVGFLNCSSFCPLTLIKYRQTMELLGEDARLVQVVYVTLDPERDTPSLLKSYLGEFHPSFTGLYTLHEKTRELAKSLGAHYQRIPGSTPGSYTIDHSVDSLVFDRKGRARLILPDELTPQQIAEDVRQLLRE